MAPNASYRRETWIAMGHLTGEMPEVCRGGNRRCDRIITNGIHAGQKLNRGKAGQYLTKSKGNTAQFVGSVGDAFSAICCLQIFRFTSSKPSKSAIASDEKFIRLRTNSFVRYCLNFHRNRLAAIIAASLFLYREEGKHRMDASLLLPFLIGFPTESCV